MTLVRDNILLIVCELIISPTSMKKRFKGFLKRLYLLLVLFTLLSYCAPYINPEKFWIAVFFSLTFPWLLVCHIGFLFFWVWRRSRYAMYSLLVIIFGWTHVIGIIGFHNKTETRLDQNVLKVMTFNAQGFQVFYGKDPKYKTPYSQYSITDFYDFIKQEEIDILCIQEGIHHSARDVFHKEINEITQLPYQYKYPDRPLTIYSKYPIKNKGILKFGKSANGGQFADIQINKKMIRLYNVHLKSNQVSTYTNKLAKEYDLQSKETWTDIEGMMRLYKRAAITRVEQTKILLEHIKKSPHQIIVCGDFNDTPQSYIYRQINEQLCDNFKESGSGLGITYRGSVPALRIDYVFSSPSLEVLESSVLRKPYSDHFGVVSMIKVASN